MRECGQTTSTMESEHPEVSFERERGVYKIEIMRNVAHLFVETGEGADRTLRNLQLFRILADADIPVFLIKIHRDSTALAVSGNDLTRAHEVLEQENLKLTIRRELTLVIIRASSMREMYGTMTIIAEAIYKAGALLLAVGDSHDSVQCLIAAQYVDDVIRNLRDTFQLNAEAIVELGSEQEDAR